MDKEKVIEAFKLTWEEYPSPVMLLSRKHDILALNKAGEQNGIPTGIKCHSLGDSSSHAKYCKAAAALKSRKAVRHVCYIEERGIVYDGFWLPVGEDFLIHFGNDITEYAKEEMLTKPAE
ncbi:MAG: hypothetical protein AB7E48_01175 [Deferribacterales bacterium]